MNLQAWAERLCAVSAPPDHVDLHLKDIVTAGFVGLSTHEGIALAQLYGRSTERGAKAAAVAAIVRSTECDDIHLPSCVTPGAVVIPVALRFTENRNAGDVTRAISAGYAAGMSMGLAIGGAAALGHGIWPTLLAAPLMAAVTYSVLEGQRADGLAHAMALALAGANGRAGRPAGSLSGRWFLFAEAAQRGISSAIAAGRGFRGDLSILSKQWLALQGGHDAVSMNAFEEHAPSIHDVGFKPFPIARQALNAVLAFQHILERNIEPTQIESVQVFVPPMNVALLMRPLVEDDRLSRLCNMGFQLACAALAPSLLYDTQRAATQPLMDFARRVSVAPARELEAYLPDHWATRVVVKTHRQTADETVVSTSFDAGAPDLAASLRDKWNRLVPDVPDLAVLDRTQLWQQIERRATIAAQPES